jgi:hypothetical protein
MGAHLRGLLHSWYRKREVNARWIVALPWVPGYGVLHLLQKRGTVEKTSAEMRPPPAAANQARYQKTLPRQRVPATMSNQGEILTLLDAYFTRRPSIRPKLTKDGLEFAETGSSQETASISSTWPQK